MKIQFEFSTADLAEVASRTVNRSPLVHRWRLRNAAVFAVIVGLLAFAFVPGDMTVRIAAGCVIALGAICRSRCIWFLGLAETARTEAFYRERLGGEGPFTCEVELTSAGVVSRQLGQELFHPWSHVASVSEVPGGIEFIYTPIGSLLVRDRAFPDPQVKADFVSLARGNIPERAQSEAVPERMRNDPDGATTLRAGPTEGEYFVAWLLFFVCVSIAGTLAAGAIGAGAAAILRTPGAAPPYGVYIFAGLSFIVTTCLSYVFFRFFVKRLVSRVQARPAVNEA